MTCLAAASTPFHRHVLPPPPPPPPLEEAEPSSVRAHKKRSPFRVIKELGSGLQGRVVLALDERDHQPVAIKLPTACPPAGASSRRYAQSDGMWLDYQVRSILQERNAHRFVQHENVIGFRQLMPGKKHGRSFVAMVTDYACNGDLFDLIAETGPLPERLAKFYFHQLIQGVSACHRSGVVHRDIKPENLLLDERFTLKICDFGLAVASPDRITAEKMMLRDVAGTALYMAPEITSTKSFRASPVDVWACGVVCFVMLTSYPPFQDAKPGDFWYDFYKLSI
ncbi:hypothetical protein P43SY_001654 [Pythium insidiosum]|uniref:non-specific serine/threonine protein kinase n=1 Tax=Pythium insidiosum TaxID=114742 RepID=A0AAD5LFG9_PYTIN|nr:hypothetical protein P43SY_001654 [Pythium insidiosum]